MTMNAQAQVFSTIATPVSDRARVIRFEVCTVQDRHGTVLDPLGLDLCAFLANPIALWNHAGTAEDSPPPRPEDAIGRVSGIELAPDRVVFDIEFATADLNPVADRVYKMVAAKFLNAVSLGFGILETGKRGGVEIITRSELREISMVLVGSNPSALAVRGYITTGRKVLIMDKDALIKLLGLDETADREAAERACMAYLVKTEDSPEQRAAVVKALDEVFPESDEGEAQPAAEGEARAADEGKDEGKDKGDAETRGLATANKYLARALADLKAEQGQAVVKAVSETERRAVAVRTVEGLIRSGRIPASAKDEAVKDELDGVLAGALRYLPEGACTLAKGAQRSGAGTRVQTRSAPPVVTSDEGVDEKAVDADADRILSAARNRNKSLYTPGA